MRWTPTTVGRYCAIRWQSVMESIHRGQGEKVGLDAESLP